MGVDIFNTPYRAYRPRREIEAMMTDVRSKTVVWVVIRRVDRAHYDLMGIWVDTATKTAEELACAQCVDESYYIGAFPVNVALPEKPVRWLGSYSPVRRQKQLERRRKAARTLSNR